MRDRSGRATTTMATVELSFSALPVHVRTARLVVSSVARRYGLPPSLLDEVRLAVGEACSRAVSLHAAHAPGEPVLVTLDDSGGRLTVVVADRGPAGAEVAAAAEGLVEAPALVDADQLSAPAPGMAGGVAAIHARPTGRPGGAAGADLALRRPPPPGSSGHAAHGSSRVAADGSSSPGTDGSSGPGGGDPAVDYLPAGFGIAVIAGLVDDVEVLPGLDGGSSGAGQLGGRGAIGTRVRMSWPLPPALPPGS